MVASLYDLLTEPVPADGPAPDAGPARGRTGDRGDARGGGRADADAVTVAHGTRYHRPDCALVDGKPEVSAVDAGRIADEGLQPCPICDPLPAP